ncbi:MAG: single-stranded-DNA-specific exonuclease RecJ [Sphaerochaetaceae bacterium]|nr:single-stranded-DNA-specific exonuclease RecJ [Sphaerochaetaceae bacterium]
MKWTSRTFSYSDIGVLQERYNLDLVSAKVFAGRGITDASRIKFYLENDISFLHNPFLFDDMETFCDRILSAVEDKEKVRIFGDRDVDGITSTALFVEELSRLGLETSYTVPLGDEPYGLTKENIDKAVNDGITLAITVDCGISCFEEINYARSKGLDFLVTDHHLPSEILPPACAVIDPKICGCGYPFADLAGCGVVAKCIWALRFAMTDLYKETFLLLHTLPGNGTIIIEAVKLENLLVTDRVSEEVVPGVLSQQNSRLINFLNCNLPVFVLDSETETNLLRKAFPKAEIALCDLRTGFERVIPSVRGKSLFALSERSRFALYSQTKSELDTLIGLFGAWVRACNPSLYKEYLKVTDLVAIGTISDMMPMEDENRIFVKNGFRQLELSSRESLIPCMSIQNLLGKRLSATDIGWQVSPLINAAGRLGQPDIAVDMILSSDRGKALENAQLLVKLNDKRKKLGEDCWERLQVQAKKSYEKSGTKFVMVSDEKIPRGITGILATRLLKAFRVPSMVIARISDNRVVGSMRSSEDFNCHEFLSCFSEYFDDFGGHACAGGFTLSPDKVDGFIKAVEENIEYLDCPGQEATDELVIDTSLSEDQFTLKIMDVVEKFEPYGEQNGPLVFMIENARIENLTSMKNQKNPAENHLKMQISFGSYKWPAVYWAASRKAGEQFNDGDIVDVVFRLGRNWYRNQENIQLTIADMRRHT